ncbi:(2Fe-2S)-binding protein [Variovorax paradoxus]|uniref:(2Fe-2S)-binding protein n=1 Tax=Variovorax paradoxus TaxID=34073 RepID=UPI00102B1480|nr:(2Fe-2S)-binding protein [Variovorax paradoxus]
MNLNVNGQRHQVNADPATPLLYVLADDLGLTGPRFGCGLAQCGSCSVLLDGQEIRSCVMPASAAVGRKVITLEGVPAWYAARNKKAGAPSLHPVQQALIDEQAPQCGYCFNGVVVKAVAFLSEHPRPTDAQIREAMDTHLCRCGTYPRIHAAIRRASDAMAKGS